VEITFHIWHGTIQVNSFKAFTSLIAFEDWNFYTTLQYVSKSLLVQHNLISAQFRGSIDIELPKLQKGFQL